MKKIIVIMVLLFAVSAYADEYIDNWAREQQHQIELQQAREQGRLEERSREMDRRLWETRDTPYHLLPLEQRIDPTYRKYD